MGNVTLEGWNVKIDDLDVLNKSPEIARLGLVFEEYPGLISASVSGDVSAYLSILLEIKRRIVCGSVCVEVMFDAGEKRKFTVAGSYILEGGEEITSLIDD